MFDRNYVNQLEAANEELQRKLEEQGGIMDSLSAAIAQTRDEMKRNRLVAIVSKDNSLVGHGIAMSNGHGMSGDNIAILYTVSLAVVLVTPEEKQKVFYAYQIDPGVKLILFKSVKDRNNKVGSIYDIAMLDAYSKGETVKPYQI